MLYASTAHTVVMEDAMQRTFGLSRQFTDESEQSVLDWKFALITEYDLFMRKAHLGVINMIPGFSFGPFVSLDEMQAVWERNAEAWSGAFVNAKFRVVYTFFHELAIFTGNLGGHAYDNFMNYVDEKDDLQGNKIYYFDAPVPLYKIICQYAWMAQWAELAKSIRVVRDLPWTELLDLNFDLPRSQDDLEAFVQVLESGSAKLMAEPGRFKMLLEAVQGVGNRFEYLDAALRGMLHSRQHGGNPALSIPWPMVMIVSQQHGVNMYYEEVLYSLQAAGMPIPPFGPDFTI